VELAFFAFFFFGSEVETFTSACAMLQPKNNNNLFVFHISVADIWQK